MEVIKEQKLCDKGVIYLYYRGNSWRAFGRSAFYLSLLYPELEVVKEDSQNVVKVYMCIPDELLMEIFDANQIYVGNEHIEMKVSERICSRSDEYIQWYNKLLGI